MTTNSSIDYTLMQHSQPIEVKHYTPGNDPKEGDAVDVGIYLSGGGEQALWQGVSSEALYDFLQQASLRQLTAFLKANASKALSLLSLISPERLETLIRSPEPLSKEELSSALANLTPEERPVFRQLDQLFGSILQAQAYGQPRVAAAIAKETSSTVSAPLPSHQSLGDLLAGFANWISSINDLMGVIALSAANIANISTTYSNEEADLLTEAQTGDEWNPDWENDAPSDHSPMSNPPYEGTSFETHAYRPGPDNIDPNSDNAQFWFNWSFEDTQLITTTYGSYVSQTQAWAQNDANLVNLLSSNTENDYNNLSAINDIMANIQALTSKKIG